ncbi:MAG: twin-arginine translocation signal domain-containing protein, partial [Draconibacterium sp.]|nr:twin-arginine translocation signal domain-containing protein [Draconibacterium sp.]
MEKSRRKFIKRSAAAFGAMTIIPSHVLFAKDEIRNAAGEIIQPRIVAPSDKVNMAFCG